jgi:hypothetical protein
MNRSAHLGSIVLVLAGGALVACPPAKPSTQRAAVTWSAPIEVASGGGYRGPWRMNESRFEFVDDGTVALDPSGRVAVAWVDQSRKDVFFQMYGPDGKARWPAPVDVSRSPRIFSWLPRIEVAGRDASEVYVLWQEIVFSGGSHGGEAFFARSTDGGRTFEEPQNLSRSMAGDGKGRLTRRIWDNGSLDLAIAEGHVFAAWTEYEGTLWLSRSTDRGKSFAERLRVSGDRARPARGPSLAAGPGGTLHLAWAVGEDPASDIRVASSSDGGRTFREPTIVHRSAGHSDAPKIALDATGTLHLVYAERSPGRPGYHIRYTRRSTGDPPFGEPKEISSPLPQGSTGAGFPSLCVRGQAVYVLWELQVEHARSRGLGFSFSTDGGRTFSTPSVVAGTAAPEAAMNGSQQGLLMRKLAVDARGTIAVVHSTLVPGRESRIWLIRGRASPLR